VLQLAVRIALCASPVAMAEEVSDYAERFPAASIAVADEAEGCFEPENDAWLVALPIMVILLQWTR
jgi:hypothetical protein